MKVIDTTEHNILLCKLIKLSDKISEFEINSKDYIKYQKKYIKIENILNYNTWKTKEIIFKNKKYIFKKNKKNITWKTP